MDSIRQAARSRVIARSLAGSALLLCLASAADAQGLRLAVTNADSVDREGEIVAIRLSELREYIPSLDPAHVTLTELPGGTQVLVQCTDEELLFLTDIGPGRSRDFILRQAVHGAGGVETRVDGRFVLPREDYAWENDRIAFRMYGPALAGQVGGGIDVWTKRVRSLIVQKWYRESEGSPPGKDTYHVDRGEGADFFSVGKTLGAGAAALWCCGRIHPPGVFSTWKTILSGPLRVQFELTYDSILVGGSVYSETCRITLDAGSNLNRIDVSYRAADTSRQVEVACGLAKRAATSVRVNDAECWLSLWGLTTPDTTNGYLGTGIVVPRAGFTGVAEDSLHWLILGKTARGTPFTYYAGAGWTRSGDFATEEDWQATLSQFVRRLRSPLRVTMERE